MMMMVIIDMTAKVDESNSLKQYKSSWLQAVSASVRSRQGTLDESEHRQMFPRRPTGINEERQQKCPAPGKLTQEEKHSPDYSGRRIHSRGTPRDHSKRQGAGLGWAGLAPKQENPEGAGPSSPEQRWCLIDPGLLLVLWCDGLGTLDLHHRRHWLAGFGTD